MWPGSARLGRTPIRIIGAAMTQPVRLALLVLLIMLLAPLLVFAQTKPFAHQSVARDADRYETWLKANLKPT